VRKAVACVRRLTWATRPVKLINPETHLVAQAGDSQSSLLMILFSRWEVPFWVVNLAETGYQKMEV